MTILGAVIAGHHIWSIFPTVSYQAVIPNSSGDLKLSQSAGVGVLSLCWRCEDLVFLTLRGSIWCMVEIVPRSNRFVIAEAFGWGKG